MDYLKEFTLLCTCLFLGVITRTLINFPIPETVYGMIYLLIALRLNIIKVNDIKTTSDGILRYLALLFVPVGAGIMTNYDILKGNFFKWIILIIIGTALTMTVTGLVVQGLQKRKLNKENGNV